MFFYYFLEKVNDYIFISLTSPYAMFWQEEKYGQHPTHFEKEMLQNKKWTDFVIWMENEVSIVLKDPLPCFFPSFCQWLPVWGSLPFISFEYYEMWNVPCNLWSLEILTLVLWLLVTNIVCLADLFPFRLIYLYFPTIWISWILIQHS